MKKFIYGLIAAILVCFCATMTTSCEKHNPSKDDLSKYFTVNEKKALEKIYEEFASPQFTKTEAFMKYTQEEVEYSEFINIVHDMHPNTVGAIADNVLREKDSVDYKTFLKEYFMNQKWYDQIDGTNKRLSANPEFNGPMQTTTVISDSVERREL